MKHGQEDGTLPLENPLSGREQRRLQGSRFQVKPAFRLNRRVDARKTCASVCRPIAAILWLLHRANIGPKRVYNDGCNVEERGERRSTKSDGIDNPVPAHHHPGAPAFRRWIISNEGDAVSGRGT